MLSLIFSAMLSSSIDYNYISNCSKSVHPVTISAIIELESNYNPYAIGVNSGARLTKQPTSLDEAIRIAKNLLDQGHNIDLGLGQINSKNLDWLNLSVEDTFNPCINISAIDYVLNHNYQLVFDERFDHESNLKKAVSMYNTGSESRGFDNGYVVKVTENALNQLKNIPLGADSEAPIHHANVFPNEPMKPISKPLEVDNVGSFKSYDRQSINKNGDDNSRERSEFINDIQQNQKN